LQSLFVEGGVARLRRAVFVGGRGLFGGFDLLLGVGRQVQKSHVLLFVGVRVDYVYAMSAWPVEQKPKEEQVSDDRDPDAFPAQGAGALVFEPVNQVKEFIRFQLLVAHALPFGEWLRRSTGRAGWNFG
jgi:hypothetical protein